MKKSERGRSGVKSELTEKAKRIIENSKKE
jgi:hypothetical protein